MRSVLRQHGNVMLGSSALSPYLLLRVFLHKESLKRAEMSFWNCFHVDLESRQAGNRKSDETDRQKTAELPCISALEMVHRSVHYSGPNSNTNKAKHQFLVGNVL